MHDTSQGSCPADVVPYIDQQQSGNHDDGDNELRRMTVFLGNGTGNRKRTGPI